MDGQPSIERAKIMAGFIKENRPMGKLSHVDQLSVHKMRRALENPHDEFAKTQQILAQEFSRFYRKRNLIVHSGRVLDHDIEQTADKLLPLVANGIDQIFIADMQYGISPTALAAKVKFRAGCLPEKGGPDEHRLVELLEPEKKSDST